MQMLRLLLMIFLGLSCAVLSSYFLVNGYRRYFESAAAPLQVKAAQVETPTPIEVIANRVEINTNPIELLELANHLGIILEYEHGREAFIKYGHEFSVYSTTPFPNSKGQPVTLSFVWADSYEELLSAVARAYSRKYDEMSYEEKRKMEERLTAESRAAEWDARHPAPHAQRGPAMEVER